MQVATTTNNLFCPHSDIEAEFFKSLVSCPKEQLRKWRTSISPIALNIYIPSNANSTYPGLVSREIELIQPVFRYQPLVKFWLRNRPLKGMNRGELTELVFLSNSYFNPRNKKACEYGFECTLTDITTEKLALMKGLHFDCFRLTINAAIPPHKQQFTSILTTASDFHFGEWYCCLQVNQADPDTLDHWLTELIRYQPAIIELQGLQTMEGAATLSLLSRRMSSQHYQLMADRFFVIQGHKLLQLRQRKTLQYTPWGMARDSLIDWVGIGLGALGKWGDGYYQNTDSIHDYRQALDEKHLPVHCTGLFPDHQPQNLPPWRLVNQLLCFHRVHLTSCDLTIKLCPELAKLFQYALSLGWLIRESDYLVLSTQGLDHLRYFCDSLQACRCNGH
jgi:hypothetical protein